MTLKNRDKEFWVNRLVVIALLLIGAGLRLWDIPNAPPGLYNDEAQHGLDALQVLEEGTHPLYFSTNNGREPIYIYLVTACVAILGRSPIAIRLPSFFMGFLTLAAIYDLATVLWDRRTGRLALAVLAVTFWHVHLSRVGFRAVLLPLFTALWMAQAARGIRTPKTKYWIAAGALYGLSWYTYMAARFTPIALGVMLTYGFLLQRENTKMLWPKGIIFCVAALVVLMPLGIYTLTHPEIVLSRSGQVSIFSREVNNGDFWGTLLKHTLDTAKLFFIRGDRIWRHNLAWRPIWDPALGFAFMVGMVVALYNFRRDAGAATAVIWTAIMSLVTLLAEDAPHFLRVVGILPTAALLPALGLARLENYLSKRIHIRQLDTIYPLSSIIPVVLLLSGFGSTTYDYFYRYKNAPLTYHWFESGAVEMAGEINMLWGTGWTGERMLHSSETGRTIYIEPQLWDSWNAVPFLVPEEHIHRLPVITMPGANEPLTFVVWPYGDWQTGVMPYINHPGYVSITAGPQVQGDKDPDPFTVALFINAQPRPEVPEAIAEFEAGILLRAAIVVPQYGQSYVRLWWDATELIHTDYTVFVHYLRNGERISQHDGQPGLGHLPTSTWLAGDLILDEHPLPDVTAPNATNDVLRVGLYNSQTGVPLPALDAAGELSGDWADLSVILPE